MSKLTKALCWVTDTWDGFTKPMMRDDDQLIPRLMSPFKSDCWICAAGRSGLTFFAIGLLAGSDGAMWKEALPVLAIAIVLIVMQMVCRK